MKHFLLTRAVIEPKICSREIQNESERAKERNSRPKWTRESARVSQRERERVR